MENTMTIQGFSNGLGQTRTNLISLWLCVPAAVLFILTISSLSVLTFPADAFYYLKSLPIFYWIGLGISIVSALLPLLSHFTEQRNKIVFHSDLSILPVLMLALFLYGTPIFSYEVPRFMDIFTHGAEALPIISDGHIDPEHTYAKEYPATFVLMAMSVLLQNIEPFILFRLIELITIMLVIALIYSIAKIFKPEYAIVAPIAFMSVFWVDQGHYSPQGLALILYLIFFLSIAKIIMQKKSQKSWLVISIIVLVAINFTSPTNAFFLFLNLIMMGITMYVVTTRQKHVARDRLAFFAALCGILFLSWSIYHAETKTVLKAEEFGSIVADEFGVVEKIKLTPSPSDSYSIVNNIRTLITVLVILSGAVMSAIVLVRKPKVEYYQLLLLIGWFATVSFVVIAMFVSPVLLSRTFMFTSIPWSIMLAIFIAKIAVSKIRISIWKSATALAAISFLVILILLVPVTRYGRDPNTYVPSSLISAAEMLTQESRSGTTVVSYFTGSVVAKYFASAIGKEIDTKNYDRVFQSSYRAGDMNEVDRWILAETVLNGKVIFTESERNNIALKYDEPELYDNLEKNVQDTYNLIINNGATRIYSSPNESGAQHK